MNGDSTNLRDFLAPAQNDGEIGRLGHYRVLKELGHGGMGMVLLAEDLHLERRVALKIILPEHARQAQTRERFLREARAAAKLKHDNVVTIYQVGEERGILFIAMELLKGNSLDSYLNKNPELSIGQVIRLAREMVEGLKAAHAVGLIHRDIKPANIWLEAPKGRVKILDFGLARDQKSDGQLTRSGAIIGTPKYMSPEQADGQSVDARSDLFSFGVVLYRLCTGKEPFTGQSMLAILKALAMDTPAAVSKLNPKVPRDLERLVARLLAKDPAQRVQTAKEVGEMLITIQKSLAAGSATNLPPVLDLPMAQPLEQDPWRTAVATKEAEKTTRDMGPARQANEAKKSQGKTTFLIGAGVGLAIGLLILAFGVFFLTREKHKDGVPSDAKATDPGAANNDVKNAGKANPSAVIPKKSVVKDIPKITDPSKAKDDIPVPGSSPALLSAPFSKADAEKARAAWAKHLNVSERKQLVLDKGTTLDLVLIPPGKFLMGSRGNAYDEKQHSVIISKPFYMAVAETTQEQYEAVTGRNPSWFVKNRVGIETSNFPVENVSWDDANTFCKKIGAELPTEAQWEYACRAGTTTAFSFGDVLISADANWTGKGPYLERTQTVKTYPANAFGLCDMHGNVWEWCRDYYERELDDLGEQDPERKVKKTDDRRVVRGGSWSYGSAGCRSAYRYYGDPRYHGNSYGFRIVFPVD